MPKTITEEEFISRAIEKHGDKYQYDDLNLITLRKKVKIFCKNHGDYFWQSGSSHLSGAGCRYCTQRVIIENCKYTQEEFVEQAKKIHGERYNYDKSVYVGCFQKIIITCYKHGDFLQSPSKHLYGQGCRSCRNEFNLLDIKHFLKLAKKKHGKKYDYSLVDYRGTMENVTIICKKHGAFVQKAFNHTQGKGCWLCCMSNGENTIYEYLIKNNFNFEFEYSFPDCKYQLKLRFDFAVWVGDQLRLIEFQGKQHFQSRKKYDEQTYYIRDQIKVDYCNENKIPLLIIDYKDELKIWEILDDFLSETVNDEQSETAELRCGVSREATPTE